MLWPVGLSEIGSGRKREQWKKTEHVFIRRAYVIPFKTQTNKPKNKQTKQTLRPPPQVWGGNPISARFLWGPLPHGFKRAGRAEVATQMRADLEPEAGDLLGGEQDTTARQRKKLADLKKGRERRGVSLFVFAFNESWRVK